MAFAQSALTVIDTRRALFYAPLRHALKLPINSKIILRKKCIVLNNYLLIVSILSAHQSFAVKVVFYANYAAIDVEIAKNAILDQKYMYYTHVLHNSAFS
jgi:hypothetical protein